MTVHELKADSDPFRALAGGKLVELRQDDRGYQVGDYLRLREHDRVTDQYLGPVQWAQVTHVQRGYGLLPGYVALSLDLDVLAPARYRCDGSCHDLDGYECPRCCDEPSRMCNECLSYVGG